MTAQSLPDTLTAAAASAGVLVVGADDPRLSPTEQRMVRDLLGRLSAPTRPRAARDVPPGQPWAWTDHRSLADMWGCGTECERTD